MRPTALKTLTWATVAAAVASALWLAAAGSEQDHALHLWVPAGALVAHTYPYRAGAS